MALLRSKSKSPEPERPAVAAQPAARSAAGGIDSLIGEGMVLNGNCRTEGALRIEGHVKGDIHARRLFISPSGRVDGDVTGAGSGDDQTVVIEGTVGGTVNAPRVEIGASGSVGGGLNVKEAVVRGRVAGGVLDAQRLVLEDTAIVNGDVTARRLALKEGGQVSGTIRIGELARKSPSGD
jgi:cytoskeletal protein CcmA (bactofilin family)